MNLNFFSTFLLAKVSSGEVKVCLHFCLVMGVSSELSMGALLIGKGDTLSCFVDVCMRQWPKDLWC